MEPNTFVTDLSPLDMYLLFFIGIEYLLLKKDLKRLYKIPSKIGIRSL